MKKIALLGPNLESPGGVNVFIHHLNKFFINKGFEVHLFPVGKTKIKDSKYIHPIDTNKKQIQFRLLTEKLKKFTFDLIIANNLRTSSILSSLNLNNDLYVMHQGRIIQNSRMFIAFKQKRKFKKIFNGKRLVFLNECFKNEFLKKFQIDISYKIIPNPFDFEEIKHKANEFMVNGEYIVYVGRLEEGKNLEYLINAYAKSKINKELWLVGYFKYKSYEKKILRLITKLNIQNKVKLLGWQNNPYPFIKNASLLVHPSKFESFGNVLVEALILNTPVIATDIKCGPREILIDELSDFLVPLKNERVFANKIYQALERYPEIKERYIEKYNFKNVGEQYLQFL